MRSVIVIGAEFSGLSAATFLAKSVYKVTVLEKNSMAGGSARKFKAEGFTFDMGPSWYWMPDGIESFFGKFGKKREDYFDLVRLDPSFRIAFSLNDYMDVPAGIAGYKKKCWKASKQAPDPG